MSHRFAITLTQLSYFAECAKTLNMTAASQQLHVAQSAVSTAISHLERCARHGTVHPAALKGPDPDCRPVKNCCGIPTASSASSLTPSRTSRPSKTRSAGRSRSPASTRSPRSSSPSCSRCSRTAIRSLTVDVLEGITRKISAALRGGRAEVVVGYDLTAPDGIAHEFIAEVSPHVILDTAHPLAGRSEVALAELAEDPLRAARPPRQQRVLPGVCSATPASPRTSNTAPERRGRALACRHGLRLLNPEPAATDRRDVHR